MNKWKVCYQKNGSEMYVSKDDDHNPYMWESIFIAEVPYSPPDTEKYKKKVSRDKKIARTIANALNEMDGVE